MKYPARVHNVQQAEREYGDLCELLLPALARVDPLADAAVAEVAQSSAGDRDDLIDRALAGDRAVPSALAEYASVAAALPSWTNFTRIERAGAVFRRSGVLGGATLGLCSLVHGYAAPAGNKPLALSGRLTERAERRLAETGRFVTAVCAPGGLERGGAGLHFTLRVRLMHAQVRRLIGQSDRWDGLAWALPINQHDMLATVLLFSSVFASGLTRLGFRFSPQELDDYQHLWRVVGWAMGVEEQLLPATFAEAERQGAFIHLTQGPPDDDSRALVRALIDGPLGNARTPIEQRRAARQVAAAEGVCRGLIGDALADELGLSRTNHRYWVPSLRRVLGGLERVRLGWPGLDAPIERLGARYWDFSVSAGLGGVPARFALPERLGVKLSRS